VSVPGWAPGWAPPPELPNRFRGRPWWAHLLLALTVVALVVSVRDGLRGLEGAISFEPTYDDNFEAYATRPLLHGAMAGGPLAVVGFVLCIRRAWRWWHVATPVLLAAIVLTVAGVAAHERGHPQSRLRSELAALSLPAAVSRDRVVIRNDSAFTSIPVPIASQRWTVHASVPAGCASLTAALREWGDPGSVVVDQRSSTVPVCSVSARHGGDELVGHIDDGAAGGLFVIAVELRPHT
jgi:hypothetical protein